MPGVVDVDSHITQDNPETRTCKPMLTSKLIIYIVHRLDFFTDLNFDFNTMITWLYYVPRGLLNRHYFDRKMSNAELRKIENAAP